MIGPLAKFVTASNSFKIVLRYFGKVYRKSNVCIIQFDWLIALYIFISLVCNASFLIVKNSGIREELSDVVFFIQTQLQQITVQEHIFGEFATASLTFVPCTSPTDTLPFNYHFLSVSIPIRQTLNCSPIWVVDNLQRFQRHINILDHPLQRKCSHFRFPYTLQSSGDFIWCRETEAHINLLLACSLPI